ncbi:necrosis inducing protein-domain-containing protein [Coniochaeta sp. 2T2.1]|nr:necrosis inducing protein-domain-containing protein [Coniochaeta sp. 2T2.1]
MALSDNLLGRALLIGLCLARGLAIAAPVERRAVIAHDAVVGFAETVPSGSCRLPMDVCHSRQLTQPETPGLATSGSSNGGCSSSTGQVYARAATCNGKYAIMYSWYMPKHSSLSGLGHRHDWENDVVWLSSSSRSARVLGLVVSQHGGYSKTTTPASSGTRLLVGYVSYCPLDHQLIADDSGGGSQPLVAWESLTAAAQTALSVTDFGDANVPFTVNLAEAEI